LKLQRQAAGDERTDEEMPIAAEAAAAAAAAVRSMCMQEGAGIVPASPFWEPVRVLNQHKNFLFMSGVFNAQFYTKRQL